MFHLIFQRHFFEDFELNPILPLISRDTFWKFIIAPKTISENNYSNLAVWSIGTNWLENLFLLANKEKVLTSVFRLISLSEILIRISFAKKSTL